MEDENGEPRNWKEELFPINREIFTRLSPDTYPGSGCCIPPRDSEDPN